MVKTNLRKIYPYYQQDLYIEITDEVAEVIGAFERAEEAYKRKLRRNKAYFSLDREDGIENECLTEAFSIEDHYEKQSTRKVLYEAIALLPAKQAKRITAHFLLEMSISEIARKEGISWHSVEKSIHCGILNLKKIMKEYF